VTSATNHGGEASHAEKNPVLVKTAEIALGSCFAKDVVVRVAVSRLSYESAQPVNVIAVLRNIGRSVCIYAGAGHGNQFIGPCGVLGMTVVNSHGASIWPGPVAYSCTMMGPTQLAPETKVLASGTWPKTVVTRTSTRPAPKGTYRLIFTKKISFTINLR
jgi:hypothetical protein